MRRSSKAKDELKSLLDSKYQQFNVPEFVNDDPIKIPKSYTKLQDIEIAALWTALLSWGQRKTIINKCSELFGLMGNEPHKFITEHREKDRRRFEDFKHRTFQYTDTLYFLEFFQWYYKEHDSLQDFFAKYEDLSYALAAFHELFFHLEDAPQRTRKHIASPARNSKCKRLNMFLRWMVRNDDSGVDFGLWPKISTASLYMPLDVHVERVARRLGLIERKQSDWKTVLELTDTLREFDPHDPVKYDYALFGMGVLSEL